MPLLSRLYSLQSASPFAALSQPPLESQLQRTPEGLYYPPPRPGRPERAPLIYPITMPDGSLRVPGQEPQMGPEWQMQSALPTPPASTLNQGAVAQGPAKQSAPFDQNAPQFQAPGRFGQIMQGLGSLDTNPLFSLGMSLMGNAQGSNWAGVGQDVRAFGQAQRERQMIDNEQRRQKAGDVRAETQFGWATQDRTREQQERERMTNWAAGRDEFAQVNPAAAFAAEAEARALAGQPLTPFQQAQLELQRQGLSIDRMNAAANQARANMDRPLRGPDATLLATVRESAARSQGLSALGDRFLAGNATNATGEFSQYNPLNFVSPERADMRAASAQMRGYMRPPNSGATSDFEQRLYGLGAMQTTNTGPQNQAIGAAYRTQAALDQARMNFFEAWAYENGNLYGAEQAFQQSPDFQRIRGEFTSRYGDPTQPTSQTQESTTYGNALPDPRNFREGHRIENDNGVIMEKRGERWVRVQTPQRRDYSRDTLR